MKRLSFTPIAVGAAAVVFAATAAAGAPSNASVVIRHQLRGCHAWSVDSGPYRAAQRLTLARGSSMTVVDDDVMPHTLVKTHGPAVQLTGKVAMRHMGASVKVRFTKAGTYRFTTKAGEDYMTGVKTVGEDNVLTLTVVVS